MKLWFALKRLALGFTLIVLAAAVLLFSDWNQRRPGAVRTPRVAVLQHASAALLDEAVQGMPVARQWKLSLVTYNDAPATEEARAGVMDGLREARLTEGRDYVIKARSAQAVGLSIPASILQRADEVIER